MGAAGYTFVIVFFATSSRLIAKFISCIGCGGNSEAQLQLGNQNMFMTEALPSRNEFAASVSAALRRSIGGGSEGGGAHPAGVAAPLLAGGGGAAHPSNGNQGPKGSHQHAHGATWQSSIGARGGV